MSYIVLARRLRPKTLDEVIGQPLVTTAIKNALASNTLHPVYLLTGTRGVGKTTIARIIAKSLNCEQGSPPCLVCDQCVMIQEGRHPDLYEIDAASRTKVEDTREILEQVHYLPQVGKKKVYLIDEVHMLSQHSFNALLKTLEEPPKHVQFVLATTEPEKIPKTILSRCLHFNLQPLSIEEIQNHLANTLVTENVTFDNTALTLIAEAATGSMRDALSLLDQCLAISPKHISTDITASLLSTIPKHLLKQLLLAIHAKNIEAIEEACHGFEQNNIDFSTLLKKLAALVIQLSIDHLRGKKHELTELWPETYLQVMYQMLINGIQDLPYAPTPKLGAVMCLIRLAAFSPITPTVPTTTLPTSPPPVAQTTQQTHTAPPTPPPKAPREAPPIDDISDWEKLLSALKLPPILNNLTRHMTRQKISPDQWLLYLDQSHAHLLTPKLEQKLTVIFSEHLKQDIRISIKTTSEKQPTLAAKDQENTRHEAEKAKQSLANDPVLTQLLNEFNVDQDSVQVQPPSTDPETKT